MSIGLVKKNSSSPFQLQRSMVPQSSGAYEDGGFNPKAVYNNDAANAAITSFGQTIGAALTARGDKKKEDVKPVKFKKPVEDSEIEAPKFNEYLDEQEKQAIKTADTFMVNLKKKKQYGY
jgi:hypothetical protein